jgi:hypothetical protein
MEAENLDVKSFHIENSIDLERYGNISKCVLTKDIYLAFFKIERKILRGKIL